MAAFLTGAVTVRTPATSANLGPGFDALGLALAWYDEVTARVDGSGVRVEVHGEGAGELPADERHLVVRAMRAAFHRLDGPPAGLRLTCHNRIPQARGLGSSSAAIVAGLLAARALVPHGGDRLPDPAVLDLANQLEGHPDNVAPCLLGGLTIAWLDGAGAARAARLVPAAGIQPVIFVPDAHGLTEQARAALPPRVPHADAARTAGRAALLVHALTGAPELLFEATEDWLHQGYRAAGAPRTAELVAWLRRRGIPAVVSGAGPSVLAFAGPRGIAELGGLPESGEPGEIPVTTGWRVSRPGIDTHGATVVVDC